MNIKKTILALGLLAAASTSFAQNPTATSTSNGLLGQRFVEFNYTLADLESFSDHNHAGMVSFNVPAIPSLLDVGASYAYDWSNGAVRSHGNTISAYANAYLPLNGVKPFLGASLGYSWVSLPFGLGDKEAVWSASVGVEIPLGSFTLTPRISYSDDFEGSGRDSDEMWTYEVEGNYWFSPRAGVFASIGRAEYDLDPIHLDIWGYRVGLRFRF